MSDSINLIADQKKLINRYIDILNHKAEDNRSGDEIAFDIIESLGLRLENECI